MYRIMVIATVFFLNFATIASNHGSKNKLWLFQNLTEQEHFDARQIYPTNPEVAEIYRRKFVEEFHALRRKHEDEEIALREVAKQARYHDDAKRCAARVVHEIVDISSGGLIQQSVTGQKSCSELIDFLKMPSSNLSRFAVSLEVPHQENVVRLSNSEALAYLKHWDDVSRRLTHTESGQG